MRNPYYQQTESAAVKAAEATVETLKIERAHKASLAPLLEAIVARTKSELDAAEARLAETCRN